MKLTIYNNGYGWSFPIGNYRNKSEEPIWVKLKFVANYTLEPTYSPNDTGKDVKKIFVNECSFDKHYDKTGKLNISMSVFSYELLTDIELKEENMVNDQTEKRYQTQLNDGDSNMFGGNVNVEEEDLPFY